MSLENLANELLFDTFEYLSLVDLFHSFNGLNSHFDCLLIEYIKNKKSFDFKLIFKEDINILRRRYLVSFVNDITSIYLSDDNTNPNEIDAFISRLFPLRRFSNLRIATFSHIYSIQKIERILIDLKEIKSLIHLNFEQCFIEYDPKLLLNIMNNIWLLTNLTHCNLDFVFNENCHLIPPNIISCSIRHLSVSGLKCNFDNLSLLYHHTPYLQHLSLNLWDPYDDYSDLPILPSLTTLNLKCDASEVLIKGLLRKTPNLVNLAVESSTCYIDGNEWINILNRYSNTFQSFCLKMEFDLVDINDIEREIDTILNTYRTQFWIDEHQWFVRCFWHEKNDNSYHINLHTLPYKFEHFAIDTNDNVNYYVKSTCFDANEYSVHTFVKNLTYFHSRSNNENLPEIQFLNIEHLKVTFPYDDHFQVIVPQFDRLKSLEVQMINWDSIDDNTCQLQFILDNAPRLFYLKFASWLSATAKFGQNNKNKTNTITCQMPPYSNHSTSVRYLNLRGLSQMNTIHSYNQQQCLALTSSPLGVQCEHLVIQVEKRTSIVELVNKMKHLRTLNIRCCDRKKPDDELIKWLHSRLPPSCVFAKDSKSTDDIRIWIR